MQTGWTENLRADPLPWLLEDDPVNPGVRYFALVELMGVPAQAPQAQEALQGVMRSGPVPVILSNQAPGGYWVEPHPVYAPKYRGSVWQVIFLAQLGADGSDARVKAGCEYVLSHSPCGYGGFSMDGSLSGMIHCLQGNLVASLIDLGWLGDERLEIAIDWLARSITGEGIADALDKSGAVRYYRSGNSGPGFLCSANNHLPCAWGAVKAVLGLSKVPPSHRSPVVQSTLEVGEEFLLSRDPAAADYPMGMATKPSRSWFQYGYPIGYVTDVLQNLEVLTTLLTGEDHRLRPAVDLLLSKQDQYGRWKMEYTYNGKTWVDVEQKGQPSKWVTLRALRVLKRYFSV